MGNVNTDVQALIDNVTAETTLEQSIETLLTSVVGQLQAGIDANDLNAIRTVNGNLSNNIKALQAAIAANTPAAPNPSDPGQTSTGSLGSGSLGTGSVDTSGDSGS